MQTSARPLTGAYDGKLLIYDRDATFLGLTQADVMNPGLFWPFAWIALDRLRHRALARGPLAVRHHPRGDP